MPYKLKGNCVVRSDTGKVVKCHKTHAQALKHLKALKVNVPEAAVASAIEQLTNNKPLLTTVQGVQVIRTGIEYPLSSGPTTFTAEDLEEAVAAQDDPAIPQPRIWLGHPDDERIHGVRSAGASAAIGSAEPAIGKVTNMKLVEQGHTIEGDLEGVPIWLANIMSSAFPSRSIEGRFNVSTPTGNNWRLVITGLALLGVSFPGVSTLEDIAAMFTEKGPKVNVTTATPDAPVSIVATGSRQIAAQVTVEDLRRSWYDATKDDPVLKMAWIRSIYLEPNEMIVDADDGGSLYRQSFSVKGDKIKFGKLKQVKIKYVNAAHGGVEAEPINASRTHIAHFDGPPPGSTLTVNLAKPTESILEINLKEAK